MAMARPHHRALSTASSSPTDHPPPNTTSSTSTHVPIATAGASHRNSSNPNHKRSHSHTHNLSHRSNPSSSSSSPAPVHPSLLQPRVAVVLNVPPPWHPWLFALRLCSILPALWWGLPCALQLLLRLLPGPDRILVVRPNRACTTAPCNGGDDAVPFAVTEGALATIWCFACGYLSFFFTDCLMSRWLIHYTPQATIVRLLTINAVNAYLTMTVLSCAGGFEDPRLMLPGWIGIATTLTVCYHITHQKINIRKETSTSINVFSIASYISMVTLLVHMHSFQLDYPTMPLIGHAKRLWNDGYGMLVQIKGSIERAEL
ncbi:N-glycosylation protein EOS1, partial [Metarhizium majus ARSEF 297]